MSVRLSVKQKLLLSFVMVIIFTICFSLNKITKKQIELFNSNLIKNSNLIGQMFISASSDMIVKKQYQQIKLFSASVLNEFKSLRYILVLDENGQMLYSSIPEYSVKILNDKFTKEAIDGKKEIHRMGTYKQETVFDIYVPLVIADSLFGLIRLGFSTQELDSLLSSFIQYNIILGIIAIFNACIITLSYATDVLSPITEFIKGTRKISSGDFLYRLNVLTNDEFEVLASAFNKMTLDLYKKNMLSPYISRAALVKLENSSVSPFLGGSVKQSGVLFSDIRGFTTISEKLHAEEVVEILNLYFNFVADDLKIFNGHIDKFIGDAIMAIFPGDGDEYEASFNMCAASLHLTTQAVVLSKSLKFRRTPDIRNGVGLSFGSLIEGSIGSRDRKDYTVIGDTVNQASRLESISKTGKYTKVMVTTSVMERASEFFEFEDLGEQEVKGKTEKVRIYEIKSLKNPVWFFDKILEINRMLAEQKAEMEKCLSEFGESAAADIIAKESELIRQKSSYLKTLAASENRAVLDTFLERCLLVTDYKIVLEYLAAIEKLVVFMPDVDVLAKLMQIESYFNHDFISSKIALMLHLFEYEQVKPFFDIFLDSKDFRVVANFIKSAGYFNNPEVIQILKKHTQSVEPRIQAESFIHLFFKEQDIIPGLSEMLYSDNIANILSGLFVLNEITVFSTFRRKLIDSPYYSRITGRINELLTSENTKIAEHSIALAGTFRLKEALPVLEKAFIRSEDFSFKQNAAEAISKIVSL